jgi:glycosyltransferase involved in cell wall biosynthesis
MPINNVIVFDVRSTWVTEFARALATKIPTTGLRPRIDNLGLLHRVARPLNSEGALNVFACRLQRGWWRSALLSERRKLVAFARSRAAMNPSTCVIFTSPHYATVADAFRACTTAYYVTDNFRACFPEEPAIAALEARLAACVTHVFPNSERIRRFFVDETKVEDDHLTVIPNGVRSENVPSAPLDAPSEPPAEMPPMPRPWALVMGNLAANTDWELLEAVIGETRWLDWVFVGPTEMPCASEAHQRIRRRLMENEGTVHFLGWQRPARLSGFARACDVAVLPYIKREPTFSGSSTRSYEHFAAGRPILASEGFAELLQREPLLKVCRSAEEMILALESLRQNSFRDGYEAQRWRLAKESTWHHRAACMLEVLNRDQGRRSLPRGAL